MPSIIEKVVLSFRQGHSDKVYNIQLCEDGIDQCTVQFQYGRRGSTLTHGTKTTSPVSMATARRLYEALVKSKMAKGYVSDGVSSTPFVTPTDSGGLEDMWLPQLLNPIDLDQVEAYFTDPAYGMQLKADGERRILSYKDGAVAGYNRKGNAVSLPDVIFNAMREIADKYGSRQLAFDGEQIGDRFFVFDLLVDSQGDARVRPCAIRLTQAASLIESFARADSAISFLTLHATEQSKRDEFEAAQWLGQEGVVFKRLDAPYASGRPNSGGPALKAKFTQTATVRVGKRNPNKRSIGMDMHDSDAGTWVEVGSCTIPPNHLVPAVGAVVEVRYLYAYPGEGGCLFQPVYIGPRNDQDEGDCNRSQLKFKVAADELHAEVA